jgi:hypothetical protein
MTDTPSKEQIAKHYKAMGDSVDMLNAGKPSFMSEEHWTKAKAINVEHLELMKAKTYWTSESMTAVDKAIADFK